MLQGNELQTLSAGMAHACASVVVVDVDVEVEVDEVVCSQLSHRAGHPAMKRFLTNVVEELQYDASLPQLSRSSTPLHVGISSQSSVASTA